MAMARHVRPPGNFQHQPGRDHDRDEEGKDHRGRGIGGNRRHVRPHQPRHEEHRQKCRDDGQRGDDGRVADLCHCVDGGALAVAFVAHAPVPGDVLDHHDGVIDKDPDGEDQREERDAVQRVAHDIGREEREQDRDRDHDRDDDRLAPADRGPDQRDDRHGGKGKVIKKLIRLLIGAFAIVARDLDPDVLGDQRSFKGFGAVQDFLGDRDRVRPGAFRNRQRHGGGAVHGAIVQRDVRHDLPLGRVGKAHIGHVADIDRPPVAGGQEEVPDLIWRTQGFPHHQHDLVALIADQPGGEGGIGALHLARQLLQRDAVKRKLRRIGRDPQPLGGFAHNIGQPDIGDLRHFGA